MAGNEKLTRAMAERNGEFYTEYSTVADAMGKMREQFKGHIVYCNCDDPSWSNFWRYFHNNFTSLGLKRLISTHYVKGAEPSYALIYDGGDDFNMDVGKIVQLHGDGNYTAGDFRSAECRKYLEECSIVATNPPFALFRSYMAQLMESGKKFIILGNQNAVTYKEIFPLIKDNKIWYGGDIHSGGVDFRIPDDYDHYSGNVFIKDGHHYINLAGIRWFTNMDTQSRHDGLWHRNGAFDQTQAHRYYEGNENAYPHYDNYDAIEVNKTKNIPIDYAGVMGVPITFLDKYSPDEFEILGITSGRDEFERCAWPTKRYENCVQHNSDGSCANGSKMNTRACLRTNKTNGIFYTADNADGCLTIVYARILIRNLHPISKANDRGY